LSLGAYRATSDPSDAQFAEAEASAPANPFYTREYFAARRMAGDESWLFCVEGESGRAEFCTAFLSAGRLTSTLELPSSFAFSEAFVSGLRAFCRARRVTTLLANTYASSAARIPTLPSESTRIARREFAIDLTEDDLMRPMSKTHRQRVRQGEKAGLVVQQGTTPEAFAAHVRLMGASMNRRRERGEDVAAVRDTQWTRILVESGAGELHQAVRDGVPVSSMLVLRARRGGYDQSSGSAPEGMQVGASHFLIFSTAVRLKNAGATVFNLGGAREAETGLRSFKSYFGAKTVDLELVIAEPAGLLRRAAIRAAAALRR
jgi:hypothetical protein